MPSDAEPIELEPSRGTTLAYDARRHMPAPPPVRLSAVADVHLPAAAGLEGELDAFYVGLLRFDRVLGPAEKHLTYRAENFALRFDVLEPPLERDGIAPTRVEVPSLYELRIVLIAHEVGFELVRGIVPGHRHIALRDPAGNWVDVAEWRAVG